MSYIKRKKSRCTGKKIKKNNEIVIILVKLICVKLHRKQIA